jgi:hypothetical protein
MADCVQNHLGMLRFILVIVQSVAPLGIYDGALIVKMSMILLGEADGRMESVILWLN